MNHMEQLALEAERAVYVMASRNAQEIEFLNLKPMASPAERLSLAARWPGRGLRGVGVLGRLADGRTATALTVAFDHIQLAGLLLAFTRYCEALNASGPQCDDSVEWLRDLWSLPDTRAN